MNVVQEEAVFVSSSPLVADLYPLSTITPTYISHLSTLRPTQVSAVQSSYRRIPTHVGTISPSKTISLPPLTAHLFAEPTLEEGSNTAVGHFPLKEAVDSSPSKNRPVRHNAQNPYSYRDYMKGKASARDAVGEFVRGPSSYGKTRYPRPDASNHYEDYDQIYDDVSVEPTASGAYLTAASG